MICSPSKNSIKVGWSVSLTDPRPSYPFYPLPQEKTLPPWIEIAIEKTAPAEILKQGYFSKIYILLI